MPGCWTRQDAVVHRPDGGRWVPLGPDLPLYTNIVMPWRGDPPAVPDHNPTGLYRRRFRLPRGGRGRPAWRGTRARPRRTILHVGGAESLLAVWCNGTFVGTSTDSRLGAEFDLTDHLVAGDNLLALMVVRWSAGTWIEDQDHWFHAGLHRRVYLESRGDPGLADLAVDADLDPASGRGRLAVTAHVPGATTGWRIRVHLETERGRALIAPTEAPVATFPAGDPLTELAGAYRHPGPDARVEIEVGPVEAWTAERPRLYRALVELVDPAG
ncbi:MAG: beta-galatosidase, partial [Actinomyces sp.]